MTNVVKRRSDRPHGAMVFSLVLLLAAGSVGEGWTLPATSPAASSAPPLANGTVSPLPQETRSVTGPPGGYNASRLGMMSDGGVLIGEGHLQGIDRFGFEVDMDWQVFAYPKEREATGRLREACTTEVFDGQSHVDASCSTISHEDGLPGVGLSQGSLTVIRGYSLLAFWQAKQGHVEAARRTLDEGLAIPRLPDATRADLLARMGWMTARQGDAKSAIPLLEQALDSSSTSGESAVARRAKLDLVGAYADQRRHAEAQTLLSEALAEARQAGDTDELLRGYNNSAAILWQSGDPRLRTAADDLLAEGALLAREIGDRHHLAWMQLNTAVGLVRRGCLRDAEQRVEESVALFRELGEGGGLGPAAVLLTWLHLVLGDGDAGVALLDGVSHDAYHGSPAVSTPALEVRALALWSTDRQSGMDLLRRGLTIDSARDIPAPARPWLTLARMAARCSDVGALEAVEAALPELNLETPEEVLYPRWTGALNARDAAAGSRELESLAQDLEALASVVDAADAYADGAVLAARAGIRSQERRLRSERDRLLAAAGGRPLLD